MPSTYKTNNQQYGSHYNKSSSVNKQRIGSSTLQFLKQTDPTGFLHEQENIAQKSRHGLFTQPMGLSPGDLYQDKKPEQVEKNIKVNTRLQQKVGPELFEKMGSTNIGDLYKDKFRQQQLYNKQKNDLSIHPTSFLAGGKQKLVKHSQFEHQKEYDDKLYQTRNQNGQVKTGLKNFYTNNMKKGKGNTTMGHLFGAYKYEPSPYDDGKQKERNQKLLHKAKIPQPFSGASHPKETFTPHFQTFQKQGEPYQPKNEDTQFRGTSNGKWNYNNPNKKGFYGTFSQFPQYIEEGQKPKKPHHDEKIWKPNFNGTSKNFQETLNKPCPAPSQLRLNEIRRNH